MTRRHAILWLCMLALTLAQAIAFMHRVVHAPLPEAGATHHHAEWVHELFAGHDDDSTCRLLDSVTQYGVDGAPATLQALAPASAVVAFADAEAAARRAELFQARGPPDSSLA